MCSLHPRIGKKYKDIFDELRARITTEVPDSDLFAIKAARQKAVDECMALKGCATAERYMKALNAPTPPKNNVMLMQSYLENIIKHLGH